MYVKKDGSMCVCTYIYSLLIEKDICDYKNVLVKMFICAFHPEIFSFFGPSFSFYFIFVFPIIRYSPFLRNLLIRYFNYTYLLIYMIYEQKYP